MTEDTEPKTFGDALTSLSHPDATSICVRMCFRDLAYLELANQTRLSKHERLQLLLFVFRCAITSGCFSIFNDENLKTQCLKASDKLSGLLKASSLNDDGLNGLPAILAARLALETARCGGSTKRMERSAKRAISYNTAFVSNSTELKAQVSDDISFLRGGGTAVELLNQTLFDAEAVEDQLLKAVTRFKSALEREQALEFWTTWYEGVVHTDALDWELQRRVALIPDPIWEAGPVAVAEEIERIRAEWLAEKLPQAEQIEFDLDQGQFQSKPIPVKAEELIETTLKQVEFARTVAAQSNCGLNSTSTAYLYIDHTLESCRNDPNAIEQNLEIARVDIVEGLAENRYQKDAKLSALEQVLERAVTDLRANHPDVAEAWEIRIKHKLRVAKAGQKQLIVEKTTELIAISDPKLGKELELDARSIAETSGEVQGGAIRRFFGRVAQMRIIVRSGEVIKRIDASSGYKGTRIVQTLQSLVDLITGLI
ncbi:MAG: hypothetical protein NXI27_31045 [Alphaproteobacteria bacterium]|nr:hypothetical protein [Alphaproteobacteria bacterium]